jgi:siroheme synthase/uroporphyrinogen-III synthase
VEMIPIGYRGYGSSKLTYGLHPKVIEAALSGKNVVRLKSGDPFIFGRGAQECQALRDHGIEYEVVAGVTSALGAAVSAGFPLTHRDFSSDVVFATGHDLRGGSPSRCKWQILAHTGGTIVIFMAGSKIQESCARLIEFGRKATTPAIYIARATCGDEDIIQGTLEDLGEKTSHRDPKKQALLVVGEVVKTREQFGWKHELPLSQKTFLVGRVRSGKSELAQTLRDLGALVMEGPQLQNSEIDFPLQVILAGESKVQIIFSDPFSVQSFFKQLQKEKRDIRCLSAVEFITLDKKSSHAIESRGICDYRELKGHCITALMEAKNEFSRNLFLLGSNQGRESFLEDLKTLGVYPEYISVYKKSYYFPEVSLPKLDGVIFPSSSSVEVMKQGPWFSQLQGVSAFTIGEKSFAKARDLFQTTYQSQFDTRESLIQLILEKESSHE